MITFAKYTFAAVIAASLGPVASAQINPGFPTGIGMFATPSFGANVAQYAADLGPGSSANLYFDSDANVPSSISGWTNGPVNLTTALGGNPWLAGGGSVKTIFLGETAGWKNDFGYTPSNAPGTYNLLATDIENSLIAPFGNVQSGWETVVNYGAGTTVDFFLNSGGDVGQGGLFYSFGTPNQFSGADATSHIRWDTRLVTTTYFNGINVVTEDINTLLIGFEDTRLGVSFHDGDFNDFVVGFQFLPTQTPPVPEPSTYGLIGAAALLSLVGYRRFKRKAAVVVA